MAGSNPCQVPMEPHFKLSKDSMVPMKDATVYRNIVGTLRYLVLTRLDPTYSVDFVSHFMEELAEEHLAVVKWILR